MTEQEAIKWIKRHHDTQMACKDGEAMRIAIECIKKQVPKEPKKKILEVGWTFHICPTCKCVYGEGNLSRYCGYCGQKIDWSKENERAQD